MVQSFKVKLQPCRKRGYSTNNSVHSLNNIQLLTLLDRNREKSCPVDVCGHFVRMVNIT